MVAILLLSPEEYGIAVRGALAEPGFRPFPGSARERELEEELELEEAEWSRDHSGDFEENEAESLDSFPAFAFPIDRTLSRIGAAGHWKRSAQITALFGVRRHGEILIVGVGSVEGDPRDQYRGTRQLTVRVRFVLAQELALADIRSKLNGQQQLLLDSMVEGELRPLSPQLGRAVLDRAFESAQDLSGILETVRGQMNAENLRRARARLPRPARLAQEAFSSAMHFFGGGWHLLRPEPAPQPSAFALDLEDSARVAEDDVISDDTVRFPGWDRSEYSTLGWWEFRRRGRRLLVKNINVSSQENRTGADLVYVRRDPDIFVLVQYKLLEQLADGVSIFRPDGRLSSQVDRLLALELTPRGSIGPDDMSSYRLGEGFTFVKFVKPEVAKPDRLGELTPGFYFPSEFARRFLSAPGVGPNGGQVHYIENYRSISSETFGHLVRDSWVGSTGDATVLLRDIFDLRDSSVGLVLAVDEPLDATDK